MFGKLYKSDAIKSAILIAISAFITIIVRSLDAHIWPTMQEIIFAGKVAGTAGFSYLLKNLLTNSDGQFMKREKK